MQKHSSSFIILVPVSLSENGSARSNQRRVLRKRTLQCGTQHSISARRFTSPRLKSGASSHHMAWDLAHTGLARRSAAHTKTLSACVLDAHPFYLLVFGRRVSRHERDLQTRLLLSILFVACAKACLETFLCKSRNVEFT